MRSGRLPWLFAAGKKKESGAAMSEKGELDLTGAKQNTGMWLVKVSLGGPRRGPCPGEAGRGPGRLPFPSCHPG